MDMGPCCMLPAGDCSRSPGGSRDADHSPSAGIATQACSSTCSNTVQGTARVACLWIPVRTSCPRDKLAFASSLADPACRQSAEFAS